MRTISNVFSYIFLVLLFCGGILLILKGVESLPDQSNRICEQNKEVKKLVDFEVGFWVGEYVYELKDGTRIRTTQELQNGECPITHQFYFDDKGNLYHVQ